MKLHHEFVHAFDTTRYYNKVVQGLDACVAALAGEDVNGYPLLNDLGQSMTLTDLKATIQDYTAYILSKFSRVDIFVRGFDVYDLLEWTNKPRADLLADKITSDEFCDRLKTAVTDTRITNTTKLAALAEDHPSPLMYITPVQLITEFHYTIMLNDWLDASSYMLKGINPNTGEPATKTDKEKREYVKGCLNQFGNLTGYGFSNELRTEVTIMQEVRDQVMAVIDTSDLLEIAKLIDDNIPKLPLMRRIWAIG